MVGKDREMGRGLSEGVRGCRKGGVARWQVRKIIFIFKLKLGGARSTRVQISHK